jgi:hypothetical protein
MQAPLRVETFNEFHLGDNLIHLNYLYRLAQAYPLTRFVHYCRDNYLDQLNQLQLDQDVNIHLAPLSKKTTDAVNCWIGHEHYFYTSPLRGDWLLFYMAYFEKLSRTLAVENPITSGSDLLFKFPELQKASTTKSYDFLINNAPPMSGQCIGYNSSDFVNLVKILKRCGYSVITTCPTGECESTLDLKLGVVGIAWVSNRCKAVIGIPNGPMWLTYNVFNLDIIKLRICFLSIQSLRLTDRCISLPSFNQIYSCLQQLRLI